MLQHLAVKNKQGLTLVEVIMTVFILSVGVLSSLLYFTTVSASNELARQVTIAATHGEYVLEEMRLRPDLANITSTDWSVWAAAEGLNTLDGEAISVSYTDTTADPLQVTATVSWEARSGTKSLNLVSEFTK